jgi:adenylate cyclase
MEIERKFLVDEPPDLSGRESKAIEQGYLTLADAGAEVRLRRTDADALVLTVKGGTGRSRVEEELELDRSAFDSLWPLTEGRRIRKTRHVLPHDGLLIELDVFEGDLEGLIVAEVEFESDDAADSFDPPGWFGEEVTGDERYLNESLAVKGRPAFSPGPLRQPSG